MRFWHGLHDAAMHLMRTGSPLVDDAGDAGPSVVVISLPSKPWMPLLGSAMTS